MSTLAVFALAALVIAGTHNNQPPEALARAAAPLNDVAASALSRAMNSEADGRAVEAAKLYREAATAGSGQAAKRLGDLYWGGAPGIDRDLAESLRWYRVAETHGEKLAQAIRLR